MGGSPAKYPRLLFPRHDHVTLSKLDLPKQGKSPKNENCWIDLRAGLRAERDRARLGETLDLLNLSAFITETIIIRKQQLKSPYFHFIQESFEDHDIIERLIGTSTVSLFEQLQSSVNSNGARELDVTQQDSRFSLIT